MKVSMPMKIVSIVFLLIAVVTGALSVPASVSLKPPNPFLKTLWRV